VRIRWYGQSAFLLDGERAVFVDPFGEMQGLAKRGLRFDYPLIAGVEADLVLVTHEHADHNAVDVIGGSPEILRSTAGTFDSPLGQVVGIASEHDDAAGTVRGPNTIFCFTSDGLRVCHFGDFGQGELRAAQRRAIGEVDVLFLPVGNGPTTGGEPAAAIVRELHPWLVVPMHYRTGAVNFLDPPDAFLDALGARVEKLAGSELVAEELLGTAGEPTVALLAAPARRTENAAIERGAP
jgi:L-ascorbate metabolism protein UlaG (beta-lactamase superfamily)